MNQVTVVHLNLSHGITLQINNIDYKRDFDKQNNE